MKIVKTFAMRRRVATRTRFVLTGCLTVVLIGTMGALSPSLSAGAEQSISLPASIPSNCASGDSTPALEGFLAAVPANSTVTFPKNGCFIISGTLLLQATTGLTIEGNGSTLEQTDNPATAAPIVELWDDTNLTITSTNIVGDYNATNSDVNEGDYGIELQADTDVNLNNDNVSDIQGDGLYLAPPYSVSADNESDALSKNVSVTNSTFKNIGYHGLSVESVDGLTVNHTTWDNLGTDAMDFEYDDYSTGFNPDGTAFWAAQDNITIENSVWSNFGSDWLASLQGQVPGVQQQNVTLTGNTITGGGPLIQITGTASTATTQPYQNVGLTITDNTMTGASLPIYGGSIATPWAGYATAIKNVAGVNISNNVLPAYDGTCDPPASYSYFCDTPYIAALWVWGSNGLTIQDNAFPGALGVLYPSGDAYSDSGSGDNAAVTECGNSYGVNAAQLDAGCTSSQQPTGVQGSTSCGPAFTSAATATAVVGSEFSYPVTCDASGATITASNLPRGLILRNAGNGTAVISGRPPKNEAGLVTVSNLTAKNPPTMLARQSLVITMDSAPVFRGPTHYRAPEGSTVDALITTTANPAPSLSTASPLPPGLSLTDNGNGSATLSGTLGPQSSGIYPIVVVADNGVGSPTTRTMTMTVRPVG
jgi:hypothetical protein